MAKRLQLSSEEAARDTKVVLALIQKAPITRSEIRDITGFSFNRVDYHLRMLRQSGCASRTPRGQGNSCKWSAGTAPNYDINNHMPEFLGRESIFHVGMALAAEACA